MHARIFSWRVRESDKEGVTLIELLVVIAIIGILAGILVANNRTARERAALGRVAQKLVSDIRDMQNRATGAQTILDSRTGKKEVPLGGYGIRFEQNGNGKYTFFADFSGNHLFDTGEAIGEQFLPDKFAINSIGCVPACSSSSPPVVFVTFVPPEPTVLMREKGGSAFLNWTLIQIRIPSAGDCSNEKDCKLILITSTGAISAL